MTDKVPIPAVVIGGFLGSGKTTLLNSILGGSHGIRAGVIVNDFGAVNIDAHLVEGVEEDTVALSNGCICCSIREDLVSACLRLLDRAEPPEILFIEASGVSDPTEIAQSLDLPALQPFLRIDGLVSLVDAERFMTLLEGETGPLACAQMRLADLVVLNKIDLVSAAQLARLSEAVANIAADARIYPTRNGRVPLELLTGSTFKTQRWRGSPSDAAAVLPHRFDTWHWRSDAALSLPRLQSALEALPATVYRAKGIVWLEELAPYRTVLQMVGPRYNLRDGQTWGKVQPCSEIVLIAAGDSIDRATLEHHFARTVGTGDESASPVLRLARRIAPHLTCRPNGLSP